MLDNPTNKLLVAAGAWCPSHNSNIRVLDPKKVLAIQHIQNTRSQGTTSPSDNCQGNEMTRSAMCFD